MADTKHHGNGNGGKLPDLTQIKNPDVAYERKDVNVRSIVSFGIVLGVGTLVVIFIVYGFFRYFDSSLESEDQHTPPVSLVPGAGAQQIPPQPRLQAPKTQPVIDAKGFDRSGQEDMEAFLDSEEVRLGTSTKTDEEGKPIPFTPVITDPATNAVTIPIEEAIKKTAATNFKVDPNAPISDQPAATKQQTINDDTLPSDASSGRTLLQIRRQ